MGNCSLPVDVLENVLGGLFSNPSLENIWVDISDNGIGHKGGEKLADIFKRANNLWSLDLSRNNLKASGIYQNMF